MKFNEEYPQVVGGYQLSTAWDCRLAQAVTGYFSPLTLHEVARSMKLGLRWRHGF